MHFRGIASIHKYGVNRMVGADIQRGQYRGIVGLGGVIRIRVCGVPAPEEVVLQDHALDRLDNRQLVHIVDLHRRAGGAVVIDPLGIDGGQTDTAGGSGCT